MCRDGEPDGAVEALIYLDPACSQRLCLTYAELQQQQDAMPTALCFCLVVTLANLALHDVAASKMVCRIANLRSPMRRTTVPHAWCVRRGS